MGVRLERITVGNRHEAAAVEVSEEQRRFLSTESLSDFLDEAPLHPTYEPYAAYLGQTIVGFVSYGHLPEDSKRWWIPLLIIDRHHQGRGYGREVLDCVTSDVRRRAPEARSLGLSYHHENAVAARLYERAGFVPTGRTDERGEVYLELALNESA